MATRAGDKKSDSQIYRFPLASIERYEACKRLSRPFFLEQLGHLRFLPFLLSMRQVDDQGGAAGGDPYQVITELEQFLELWLLFHKTEMRRAERLHDHGRHLRVEALIDPGAAEFDQRAAGDLALGAPGQDCLVFELVGLDR